MRCRARRGQGTRRTPGARRWMRARGGITMVEVMVALTMLVIALSSIAALSVHVSKQAVAVTGAAYGTAAMGEEAGQLMVVPYDSLAGRGGCESVAYGSYSYQRCVTVTRVSSTQSRVTMVLTPARRVIRSDTLALDRTRWSTGSPFNSP